MSMNTQGRPSRPQASGGAAPDTFSGSKGLAQAEPLLFEVGTPEQTGVDLPKPPKTKARIGKLARKEPIGLAGLSEPQALRHYVRLSQQNYAIDLGLYPLGSCTMKHNPRLNEKVARLPGFGDVHPLQPQSTVQGAIELMHELGRWLTTLTGMPSVALSPKAGAHGELCGMLAIKAALGARGEGATRRRVLVPESAHGTNPATAIQCGFTVDEIKAKADGRVDVDELKSKLGPDLAGVMLTNPSTCGLFERDIKEIADLIHEAGGYFYCDGANFNAIVGRVRPGDLGVDAMHINLHKTFSTPHGGGGPGSGPTVFSEGPNGAGSGTTSRWRNPRSGPCGAPIVRPTRREAEATAPWPLGLLLPMNSVTRALWGGSSRCFAAVSAAANEMPGKTRTAMGRRQVLLGERRIDDPAPGGNTRDRQRYRRNGKSSVKARLQASSVQSRETAPHNSAATF